MSAASSVSLFGTCRGPVSHDGDRTLPGRDDDTIHLKLEHAGQNRGAAESLGTNMFSRTYMNIGRYRLCALACFRNFFTEQSSRDVSQCTDGAKEPQQ